MRKKCSGRDCQPPAYHPTLQCSGIIRQYFRFRSPVVTGMKDAGHEARLHTHTHTLTHTRGKKYQIV